MTVPSAYCNVEDLPGDPSPLEDSLTKLRVQHALYPFDDVQIFGNVAMLMVNGEMAGSVDLEALEMFGGRA